MDNNLGEVEGVVNKIRGNYFNIVICVAIGGIFGPIGALIGGVVGFLINIFISREEKLRRVKADSSNYLAKAMSAAYTCKCSTKASCTSRD